MAFMLGIGAYGSLESAPKRAKLYLAFFGVSASELERGFYA